MNPTKWKKGERIQISYAVNESGIRCRHCSATFSYNSRNIKHYDGWSYLCKDCKTLAATMSNRLNEPVKGNLLDWLINNP